MNVLTFAIICFVRVATADEPTCPSNLKKKQCLATSLPILKQVATSDPAVCCAACANMTTCASWTVNLKNKKCLLRETAFDFNSGNCYSGKLRPSPPTPAPTPTPPRPRPPSTAPNVLLLLVDDMRPWLPSYGAPEIRAPHLAALAASAVQFENCYVQQAVCSPTRNSFMTGRRPDRTRLWNFKGSFRSTGIDANSKAGSLWRTLPGAFTTSGWNTAGVGKLFHPGSPPNFDIEGGSWTFNRSTTKDNSLLIPYVNPASQVYDFDTRLTKVQRAAPLDDAFGPCVPKTSANTTTDLRITTCDLDDENTTDVAITQVGLAALAKLAKLRQTRTAGSGDFGGRPFFLGLGFHKPHPYWPLPSALQMSYRETLSLPKYRHAPENMPPTAFMSCDFLQDTADATEDVLSGHGILPNESFTDTLTRKIRAGYAAGVTHTDTQVGAVMKALDESGEANRTIVLFSTDHGWGLGENGMWCKYTVSVETCRLLVTRTSLSCFFSLSLSSPWQVFENQVRVPLIIRVPWLNLLGTTATGGGGLKSNALVEMVDIMPTLLDFAGILPSIAITEALDGSSLKPLLLATAAIGVAASARFMNSDRSLLTAQPPLEVWNKNYSFSQYPRCMNSTLVNVPPYTANRDACCGHPADEFTHMGLSIRSSEWRYSLWARWDGTRCAPMIAPGMEEDDGEELYDHRGVDVPGNFDGEHINVASVAANAAVMKVLRAALIAHFTEDGGALEKRTCPPPTSEEEQAGIDMTFERLYERGGLLWTREM